MARIPIEQSQCPNCLKAFPKPLARKTHCKSCGQDIYVRSLPNNAGQIAVTQDELDKIASEWVVYEDSLQNKLENQPLRTEEEYKHLFNMPITFTKRIVSRKYIAEKLQPVPVRWVLGSWCKEHCKRIAGQPSCHDLQGVYMGGIDTLRTLPAAEVACSSEEFLDWWSDHHSGEDINMPCDCVLELSYDGGKTFHRVTG